MRWLHTQRVSLCASEEAMDRRRLLVTGGSGFVGRSLGDLLLETSEQWDPVFASRSRFVPALGTHLIWDVTERFAGTPRFDVVVHAATPASAEMNIRNPAAMFWTNVRAMENVLEMAERCATPPTIVFTSSGGVYGEMPADLVRFPEGHSGAVSTLSVRSAYAEGKRAAEYLLTEATTRGICRGIVLRLFAFSGTHLPMSRHFAIGNFVRDAVTLDRIVIQGDGSPVRSYLDQSDLAAWIIAALERGAPGVPLHVGSERAISIGDLAELVASRWKIVSGRKVRVEILGESRSTDGVNRYVPETLLTRSRLMVAEETTLEESIDQMLRHSATVLVDGLDDE